MKRLLTYLILVMCTSASLSAKTAYAVWCEGNHTVYFDYTNIAIKAGSHFDGQTVTSVETLGDLGQNITKWGSSALKQSVQTVRFMYTFEVLKPTNLNGMFSDCVNLKQIIDLKYLNTSEVTDMMSMFEQCSSLETLDLSSFNTSKVENMSIIFVGCKSLINLDLSSFDTSNVKNMNYMFTGCESLTNLDLSSFNTSKVTTMSNMFLGCISLKMLDLSSFDTSNVTDMTAMFSECKSLTTLHISTVNTSNVKTMNYMFQNCESLINLDLFSFDTSNVKNMTEMFHGCSSLQTIYCNDSWTCENSQDMFSGCTLLNGATFYNNNMTDVSMANPNNGYFTKKEIPYAILCGDSKTLFFDFTDNSILVGDTYEGQTVTELWSGNEVLNTGTNYPKWMNSKSNVDKVVIQSSFSECHPTSTFFWFYRGRDDEELRTIEGLENLNTDQVTTMDGMFRWVFVTELDLSNFKTSNVTSMNYMFDNCTYLKTIYAKNWDISKVTNSNDMFNNCTSLEGGAGTTYSSSHRDASYAHIDGGTSNPGYFTVKKNSGDVNEDDRVDINDVVAIINTMAGTANWPNADVNDDTKVDINDVVAVINIMANK